MKIKLDIITAKVPHRPSGFLADCLRHGRVDGNEIEFSDWAWRYLTRKYRMLEPTRADMEANYSEATAQMAARGFAIIPEEGYRARLEICDKCKFRQGEECKTCGRSTPRLYWRHARCPELFW